MKLSRHYNSVCVFQVALADSRTLTGTVPNTRTRGWSARSPRAAPGHHTEPETRLWPNGWRSELNINTRRDVHRNKISYSFNFTHFIPNDASLVTWIMCMWNCVLWSITTGGIMFTEYCAVKKIFFFVTLEHKTSHKGKLFKIEIYASSESWINWCMVWTIFVNLESEGAKNLHIDKIIFKVVQIKFLAMHITNQKLSFDIFMVGTLLNIFMEHDLNI